MNDREQKINYIENCINLLMKNTKNMDNKGLEDLYLRLVGLQLKTLLDINYGENKSR